MDELQLQYPCFGLESYHHWLENYFDIKLNIKRIRRLMQEMGNVSLTCGLYASKPHPGHKTYPCLLNDLSTTYPNQVWCADNTYLHIDQAYIYIIVLWIGTQEKF